MPPKFDIKSKLALLEVIREKKSLLFGQFSSKIDKKNKQEAWEEVLVKAKSLQLVKNDRNWTYVRDSLFAVWKTRALEKKDNSRKTGTAGGKKKVLDESEEMILEIVGKLSPLIEGLSIGESGNHVPVSVDLVGDTVDDDEETLSGPDNVSNRSNQPPKKKTKLYSNNEKIFELKCKEREAKIALIDASKYKVQLELMQLEKSLGLPPSEFTKPLM